MGNWLRILQGPKVLTIKGPGQLPGQSSGHKIEGNLLASREGANAARSWDALCWIPNLGAIVGEIC
jgi:hypothetical protein